MIVIHNLSVQAFNSSKQNSFLLQDIEIRLLPGESCVILGSSGAGKTTLIRSLAGLVDFTGSITFNEKPLKSLSRTQRAQMCGVMLQNMPLFEQLTVLENLMQPLTVVHGWSLAKARKASMYLLERCGMALYADRYPHQLSGGQVQRVVCARALAPEPKILILDEPTSALDVETKSLLLQLFIELKKRGVIIIIATHDKAVAQALADVVIWIENGRIVEKMASDYKSDSTRRIDNFMKK